MNLFKHIKSLIIGLTLAACINSNAFDLSRMSKKGICKVDFTPCQIGVLGNLFATDNVYGLSFALPMCYAKNNYGFATGIWGESKDHRGVQLNMINLAHELSGVQIGLFGILVEADGKDSELSGVQMNLLCNISKNLFGFQSGIFNQSGRLDGMQSGFVNLADQGLQFGFVNFFNPPQMLKEIGSHQSDARVQIGLYNHSSNSAFQIGVLNYNKNSLLPYFPLFNFSID
jgi:hypothetical protein